MSGPKTSDYYAELRVLEELRRQQEEERRRQEEERKKREAQEKYIREQEEKRREAERLAAERTEKKAQMHAAFEVGFGLSFAAEDSAPPAPEPERPAADTAHRDRILRKIEELAALPLTAELRERTESYRREISGMTDSFTLRNYEQAILAPFLKSCEKQAALAREHEELMVTYAVMKEACGETVSPVQVSEEGNAFLEAEIQRLKEADLKRREKEYIDQSVDEVMRELGYELIGDRIAVKKNGKKIRHQLYSLRDGTAVDVTYSENGQITMELGGLDDRDRKPEAAESAQLAEDMRQFCGDYDKFCRRLAERGILIGNSAKLPPSPEFAQIINVKDYRMRKAVSKYAVRTRKKASQAQRRSGN